MEPNQNMFDMDENVMSDIDPANDDKQKTEENPKKPRYDANMLHLGKETEEYLRYVKSFVNDVYSNASVKPMIGGKEVDLKNVKNSSSWSKLYIEAKELAFNDPEIQSDAEKMVMLGYQTKLIDDKFGIIQQGLNIVNKDMLQAAKLFESKQNVKFKGTTGPWMTALVDEKGNLRSREDAEKRLEELKNKEIKRHVDEFERKYPKPDPRAIFNRVDNTYASMKRPVDDRNSFSVPITSDYIEWQNERERIRSTSVMNLKNSMYGYDNLYKHLMDSYEEVGKSIPAIQKDMLNMTKGTNKGGVEAVIPVTAEFDVSKVENTKQKNEKIIYAKDFMNIVTGLPDAKFSFGNRLAAGNRVSSMDEVTNHDVLKTLFKDINDDFFVQLKKSEKSGNTAQNRLRGSIEIEPVVAGDDKFHAVHINFRPEYLKKYIGTKDDPGLLYEFKDNLKDGFTVFYPAEAAIKAKMKISVDAKKGSTVSPVEGLISMAEDNSVTRTMPMGGMYRISLDRNPDSPSYTISGYTVNYNPSTGKYDSLPFNQYKLKDNLDLTVDINEIDRERFKFMMDVMKSNIQRKNEHYRIMGKK